MAVIFNFGLYLLCLPSALCDRLKVLNALQKLLNVQLHWSAKIEAKIKTYIELL